MKAGYRTAAILVVLAMLTAGAAYAAPAQPGTDPSAPTVADDDYPYTLSVGAEYVSDAPPAGPGGSDLPICRTSAINFYNRMRAFGYNAAGSFIYSNAAAWETDWKRAAKGGSENSYVDNVDIAYYCDHGNEGVVYFPWDHTDNWLDPRGGSANSDCYQSYGTKDNEWMAFGTCLTLKSPYDRDWANCMYGQHLILGYTTVSYDADEGGTWANQMIAGKTVSQAWFTMCDLVEPSSVQARVIAEDWTHFYDKLHPYGPVGSDYVDAYYYKQDHNCAKPRPLAVDTSVLAAIPAYAVQARDVNAGYVASVAGALGLQGNPMQLGNTWVISDTTGHQLQIDAASGGYLYQDMAHLWLPPQGPLSLPGDLEALALADTFLGQHAQALPGSQYATGGAAMHENVSNVARGTGFLPEMTLAITDTDVMVFYGRTLTIPATGNAPAQAVSVTGPGSSTKVYIGQPQAGLYLLSAQNPPLALQGGSRDVQTTGTNITVKDSAQVWAAFLADPGLAIAPIPLNWDTATQTGTPTLAYYEQPQSIPQQQLIPAWVYTVDFSQGGTPLATDVLVYVPANTDYNPPAVTITGPANGINVPAGKPLTFTANATGNFTPFTYEWSGPGGLMGTTPTVQGVPLLSGHSGGPETQTFTVKVTNANGQARMASVSVTVFPPTYLPALVK